ncbi:MAG: hypothetical protein DI565_12085 [Ancylobacter novellus]|uniref:DNA-directed DNA polymerase family A palm domain-containing protein n=1 Tax=Ancylobacter novellus TaxID=921 RepID=A0A2W5M328_ANCNO|nr:MAG: hypothetical protein DI565_12085 [Ancylobacter novellus]
MTAAGSLPCDQVSEEWDAQFVASVSQEGDLWLDPWLTVDHPAADAIVARIMAHYAVDLAPTRRRRLTSAQTQDIETAARIIVANLALVGMKGSKRSAVVVSRQANHSKRTRYDSPRVATLHGVLEQLAATFESGGAISLTVSRERGRASTMSAGRGVRSELAAVDEGAFFRLPGREVVLLRHRAASTRGRTTAAEPVDYPETNHTRTLRTDVVRVNEMIRGATISLLGDPEGRPAGPAPQLYRSFVCPSAADVRFDLGGRLFGGWWQSLPRARRNDIRLDGEPIADLDFSSMFLRLAYLEAGVEPPAGDLYADVRGLEDPKWREGVKQVASALLFRTTPMIRLPKDMGEKVPPGMTGGDVRKRLLERHPKLATVFETGCGLRLMWRESEVLMAALLALADAGVSVLPMHDGLMVAASKANEATNAMEAASFSVLGFRLPIALKTLGD